MDRSIGDANLVSVNRQVLENLLLDLQTVKVDFQGAVTTLIALLQPALADFVPAVLRQRDYLTIYGGANSPYSISQMGCVITSFAFLLNSVLKRNAYTPVDVQTRLAAAQGYAPNKVGILSNVIWGKLAEAFPVVQFVGPVQTTGNTVSPDLFARIDAHLSAGTPVLCQVDNSPITGIQQHWVALVQRIPSDPALPMKDYWIADPWWPDVDPVTSKPALTTLLSHYPQNIGLSKTVEHAIEALAFYDRLAPAL